MPHPLRVYLRAGLISGVVAAVLAVLVSLALQSLSGDHYDQLGVVPVAAAALLTNLVGGGVYGWLAGHVSRPSAWFAALALIVAAIDTQLTIVSPPSEGFYAVATPLHFIVAVVALSLIPTLVSGRRACEAEQSPAAR